MSDYNTVKIGVMDLGINNIFSIIQVFKNLGCKTEIYKSQNKFKYKFIVIPGVGTFDQGMKSLKKKNFDKDIYKIYKENKNYIIGICLGMQLLFEESFEFKKTKGLGLIQGSVKKFPSYLNINTHIGWKKIKSLHKIIKLPEKFLYYFVHSYYCDLKNIKDALFETQISKFKFYSAVKKRNLIGLQFHPEKSGEHGIKLIERIIKNNK